MCGENAQSPFVNFPSLYRDRSHGDTRGYSCGPGWFNLIYRLSTILTTLIEQIPVEEQAGYYVVQVKEKFGDLQFHMSCRTVEMREAIRAAKNEARQTCQDCGTNGEYCIVDSWAYILCKDCKHEKEEKQAAQELRSEQ